MVSDISLAAAPSMRSRFRQVSINSANCVSGIARPGATGWIRRACSSKSQMNSRPVPSLGEMPAVPGDDGDARSEQRPADGWNQRHPMHEIQHLRRVRLARTRLSATEQRIAARHRAIGREILGAADPRLAIASGSWEGGAGILGLEPVHHGLDAIYVLVYEVVFLAQPRRHIHMGDVVAGGRIDAVQRLEKNPVTAQAFGDPAHVGPIVTGEAIAQLAQVVAGIGVVESGVAFQRGFTAGRAVFRQRHGEQGVTDSAALAKGAAAAARAFQIAGRQVDALGDGTVDLILVEPLNLCRCDSRTEDAEHRSGMEPARHDRRDEFGGHALHDLVGGRHGGDEFPAGALRYFRRRQRCRQDRDAGMGEHAKRVPLAAGEDHFRIDEGCAAFGESAAVAEHGCDPAAAGLFLLHQRKRLSARRHVAGDQSRCQRLQRDALGPVHHVNRQIGVPQVGDERRELPAQRHGCFLSAVERRA